jgi:Carbohydrate family 9 binding domain-like
VKKLVGTAFRGKYHLQTGEKYFIPEIAETTNSMVYASEDILKTSGNHGYHFLSYRPDQLKSETKSNDVHSVATLMVGCPLAYGGMARRDEANKSWTFTAEFLKEREKITIASDSTIRLYARSDIPSKFNDVEKLQGIQNSIKELPAGDGSTTVMASTNYVSNSLARELYYHAVEHYPTQPATLPAYRWLARYHASSETLRRIELGHMTSLRPTEFYELPKDDIQQVGHTEAKLDRAKFRTSEAMRGWFGTGPNLEAKLFAVNPLLSREPSEQLAFHAARLKLGLTADAEKAMGAYYRTVVGRAVTPGANPWFDALAAELHRMNPKLMPANPKPVAACAKVSVRPILDGKLDDDAWKGTAELALKEGSRELAGSHATTARMAFDEEYLYLGVTCRHPNGEQVPPAETRKHDDDVAPHDRVELMLDLDRDYATYYRLRVDHRGCTAEDCWGDSSWNPKWFVAVNPTATGWTAEVAIPLAELTGRRPTDKSAWAANLVRVVPGRGVLAWRGPADATPRPEAMGLLEFRGK